MKSRFPIIWVTISPGHRHRCSISNRLGDTLLTKDWAGCHPTIGYHVDDHTIELIIKFTSWFGLTCVITSFEYSNACVVLVQFAKSGIAANIRTGLFCSIYIYPPIFYTQILYERAPNRIDPCNPRCNFLQWIFEMPNTIERRFMEYMDN